MEAAVIIVTMVIVTMTEIANVATADYLMEGNVYLPKNQAKKYRQRLHIIMNARLLSC